jgi:hypothetical protein
MFAPSLALPPPPAAAHATHARGAAGARSAGAASATRPTEGARAASASLFGLEARGVESVETIPPCLSSVTLPNLSLLEGHWSAAVGVAPMSFTESIAGARAFVRTDGNSPYEKATTISIAASAPFPD